MSTDLVAVHNEARERMLALVPLAIGVLGELLLDADRDTTRLAAAEALLDRVGVVRGPQGTAQTSSQEHAQARDEAQDLVARLRKNNAAPAILAHTPALDTLVVLEGVDEELPISGVVPGLSNIIDV